MKPRFLIKIGYYIVSSPSITLEPSHHRTLFEGLCLYWPETGTEFPSVRVIWDPTPIKSSSSIWKQTLLLIILSMVNLLFGGVITYRTYSSQGIRMSTKFLIESSPKNMLKFRWQLFYTFKSYKLDRYLSVTSVVKFWEVNSKYIFAQISVLEKQLFDLTFTDFQINGQNVPKSEFQHQISSESVWFFFIYIYHFFRFSFVTDIFERLFF